MYMGHADHPTLEIPRKIFHGRKQLRLRYAQKSAQPIVPVKVMGFSTTAMQARAGSLDLLKL
jgi:hypothetical protein